MGHLHFVVPRCDRLPDESLERAYLSGMEGIPWRCTKSWLACPGDASPREFVIERSVPESGNLFVPWTVNGRETMMSTATLMERDAPYNLPVELARGLVSRLRNQLADWQMMGLAVPPRLESRLRDAVKLLVQATTAASTQEEAADCAEQVLQVGLESLDLLVHEYTQQSVAAREQQSSQLPTLLGVRICHRELSDAEQEVLPNAVNALSASIGWRDIEATAGKREWQDVEARILWGRELGMRVIAGPLLLLDNRDVPDWLYLWEDDFDQIQAYVVQHIRSVVERFRGRVHIWNCAARISSHDALSLSEEQRLRLVVNAIEEVRQHDASTPLIVSLDRPWAEHLANEDLDLSPLHFADSLLRADLGIAGIGLEVNIGYWPGGTLPRDLLEISQMLDRWSLLGIPLIIYLTMPSAAEVPPESRDSQLVPLESFAQFTSIEYQKLETDRLVQLMLAKHSVQGIIWNQLSDAGAPRFPHGGLFDSGHHPKPVLDAIREHHLT